MGEGLRSQSPQPSGTRQTANNHADAQLRVSGKGEAGGAKRVLKMGGVVPILQNLETEVQGCSTSPKVFLLVGQKARIQILVPILPWSVPMLPWSAAILDTLWKSQERTDSLNSVSCL